MNPKVCRQRWLSLLLGVLALSPHAHATTLDPHLRQQILDTVRPVAAARAGQTVRIKVDHLNVDGGWAVLYGGLVGAPGVPMDWTLAQECDPELDKSLWVVLKQKGEAWQIRHMEICSPEPPYWYLEQYGGFVWPCGVYAGLDDGQGDLAERCRATSRRKSKH